MRIVVVGAGVIGVTSAWYLRKAGHDVTVIERREGPGLETSFANAAQISPTLSAPWAVPGLLRKVIGWTVSGNSPLVIGKLPDRDMARWLWRMYQAASYEKYIHSKRYMVTLAEYSRDCMADLRAETNLSYSARQKGTLVLFRHPLQQDAYAKDLKVLDTLDMPYETLGRRELTRYEPNINIDGGLIGGVHLPVDETGDCYRFTSSLESLCREKNVRFLYGTDATLTKTGNRVSSVQAGAEEIPADCVVLATGVKTNELLTPFGLRAPIYPVKGYSLTVDADSDSVGPHSTIADETYKVGITGLGSAVRVGGTAELVGYDLAQPEQRYATLFKAVRNLFPEIAEDSLEKASRWAGLRPMTAEGPPLLGLSGVENLFLNVGHGTLGWTMACGSGKAIASLVTESRPDVALPPLPSSLLRTRE